MELENNINRITELLGDFWNTARLSGLHIIPTQSFFSNLTTFVNFACHRGLMYPKRAPASEEESPQLFDKYASDYMFGY